MFLATLCVRLIENASLQCAHEFVITEWLLEMAECEESPVAKGLDVKLAIKAPKSHLSPSANLLQIELLDAKADSKAKRNDVEWKARPQS